MTLAAISAADSKSALWTALLLMFSFTATHKERWLAHRSWDDTSLAKFNSSLDKAKVKM